MPDTGLSAQPGPGDAPAPVTGDALPPGNGQAPCPGTSHALPPEAGQTFRHWTSDAPPPETGQTLPQETTNALPPAPGQALPLGTGQAHLPRAAQSASTRPAQELPPRTGQAPEPGHAIFTLPNVISFARLCVVPLAIWLVLHQRFAAAFACFVAAGISDAVDGWLARRRGGTVLGAALDPLADKALMIGMFVTLAATAQLPDWLAILVVFRDLLIVGGVALLWATSHTVAIRPLRISKLNTGLQIGLVALVLGLNALGLGLPSLRWAAVILVTASTLASGAAYVVRTARPA